MSEVHWADLLHQQQKHIKDEDKLSKEHQQKMKQLYKEDLQRMIYIHELQAKNEKDEDRQRMQILMQKQDMKKQKEDEKNFQLDNMRKRMAQENMQSLEEKRHRICESQEKEKNKLNEKYKKLQTQLSEERESRLKHLSEQKSQIARALDEQIYSIEKKKVLQKMEDEKLSRLRWEIEEKKQAERRKYMRKIKFGYQQSSQVYKTTEHLIDNQQKKKQDFLNKLIKGKDDSLDYQLHDSEKLKKMGQVREVSQFNKHRFQDRILNQKHKSLQQVLSQKSKMNTISMEIQQENMEKQRKMDQQRRRLKYQLQKQMHDQQRMKLKYRNLSEQQRKINESGGKKTPILPGITKDYSILRQQKIIEKFLKVHP